MTIMKTLNDLRLKETDEWHDPAIKDSFWKPPVEDLKYILRGVAVEADLVAKYMDEHPTDMSPRRTLVEKTIDPKALAEGREICRQIDARKKLIKEKYLTIH